MFPEKCQYALPCIFRRFGMVVPTLIVEEGVLAVGIDFDVMGDVVLIEGAVQFLALRGGEVSVRVGADDGAEARDRAKRARVAAIEGRDGFEPLIGAGPGDGEAAAHAETDGPQ